MFSLILLDDKKGKYNVVCESGFEKKTESFDWLVCQRDN